MQDYQRIVRFVKTTLHNDETSTDDELVKHFMEECNITETQARRYVAQREKCLNNYSYDLKD